MRCSGLPAARSAVFCLRDRVNRGRPPVEEDTLVGSFNQGALISLRHSPRMQNRKCKCDAGARTRDVCRK